MEHIERETLYTDPVYRFQFVAKFMGFGDEDVDVIKGAAELVKPLVPVVVDAVYSKLHQFDITWSIMAKRHEGFVPKTGVVENAAELNENADQIKFRKDMLSKYFDKLLTNPYDERMIKYLEYVARIHTDTPTKKSKINVDLIHINALLGYVEQVLIGGIKTLNLDRDTEYKAIAAFGKLLWIQMDFFLKFYCRDGYEFLEGTPEYAAAHGAANPAATTTTTVAIAQPGILTRLWRFFF
ncbi:MAG: Protoglobin-domain-containing protein [Linnemannia gamsii]|nr:MAG: Protoglobin-domain-containing protein [Linnemannia gamsii]